jgi:hypothetical protein
MGTDFLHRIGLLPGSRCLEVLEVSGIFLPGVSPWSPVGKAKLAFSDLGFGLDLYADDLFAWKRKGEAILHKENSKSTEVNKYKKIWGIIGFVRDGEELSREFMILKINFLSLRNIVLSWIIPTLFLHCFTC